MRAFATTPEASYRLSRERVSELRNEGDKAAPAFFQITNAHGPFIGTALLKAKTKTGPRCQPRKRGSMSGNSKTIWRSQLC